MAPLRGSGMLVPRDRCGGEFDEWFLDSSSTSSSSLGLEPLAHVQAGKGYMSGRYERRAGDSAEGAGEYDPRYPHLPVGFLSRQRVFPLEVEGYDPFNPAIQPSVSPPPPPSPSPLPLNNTTPLFPPPSSSSLPPPSSSSLSTPSSLQKCEIAVLRTGKRKHRAGDRRRLDAMKRRRIEERRVVRGRDPVTGGRVVVCEDGKGRGRGRGIGKRKGKGTGKVGERVGKGGSR